LPPTHDTLGQNGSGGADLAGGGGGTNGIGGMA
jgi:hypothetical protein